MKTRNGFVSNSSSTSFVIAVRTTDKNEVCEHCGCTPMDWATVLRMSRPEKMNECSRESFVDGLEYFRVYQRL